MTDGEIRAMILREKQARNYTYRELSIKTGYCEDTLRNYVKYGKNATLHTVQCLLNAMGYEMAVTRKENYGQQGEKDE